MSISVLIVDDEPLAREGVALHLQRERDFLVVAMCGSGREAIKLIHQQKPDLVFLDIHMPGLSGFDVIEALGVENMPPVIFLTAYENFALKAFDVCAVDYLLKPIDPARFAASVDKVRQHFRRTMIVQSALQLSSLLTNETASSPCIERLIVKSHGHTYFIPIADILWVEANGDYVDVYTPAKTHLVRETMHNIEQQLIPWGFQRIHRSAIVRLTMITELITHSVGDYYLVLNNGKKLKLSRNYRDVLLQKLHLPSL
jgi:two-component system LytT family response regulator